MSTAYLHNWPKKIKCTRSERWNLLTEIRENISLVLTKRELPENKQEMTEM
jgi:hypothetical protein